MKFTPTHVGSLFKVSNATPQTGESVFMNASHVRADGSLRPLPFLSKGRFLAVDSQGGNHEFNVGSCAESVVWPQGGFSVVAQEPSDYWCINPVAGQRIKLYYVQMLPKNAENVIGASQMVYALFTQDVTVGGVPVRRGQAVRLSPASKLVKTTEENAHAILFTVEQEV